MKTQINHQSGEIIKTMVNNETMSPAGSELTYLPGAPIIETNYDPKTGKQISQKEVSSEEIDGRTFERAREVLNRQIMYLWMCYEFNDALLYAMGKQLLDDK